MRYMLFTRLLERAINLRGNRAMAAQLKLIDSEDKKGNMDRQKALEAALSQIVRAFGKASAMKLGSRAQMDIEPVSTASLGPLLPFGIVGLPRARFTEIFAPERSCHPYRPPYSNLPRLG